MTKDGARRIATSDGAILADSESLENVACAEADSWFEPAYWRARGELAEVTAGRGAAWFIGAAGSWVLRHYRRGGFIARLSRDRYVWAGEPRVRAVAEWRLLADLAGRGLPVPKPVAARYRRRGMFYRCDLITERIVDAQPMSSLLTIGPLKEETWRNIGAAVARLHAAGADHADLNAHNILVDRSAQISIIDFDRGRLRGLSDAPAYGAGTERGRVAPAWALRNLSRLQRSLAKIGRQLPAGRCSTSTWGWLMAGYAAALDRARAVR